MNLAQIIKELDLSVVTHPQDFASIEPSCGYASDLLSCVMSGAQHHGLWVTLQAHANIIAVAALLDLCGIIITEGAAPDAATIAKANEEGINLFTTPQSTFWVVGRLWELGLRDR